MKSILIIIVFLFSLNVFAGGRSPQNSLEILAGVATGDTVKIDYSVTNVTDAAFVEIIASTSTKAKRLEIFHSSGEPMFLGIGAAASEVTKAIVFPGGQSRLYLDIPKGSRLAVKAANAATTINTGELFVNFYGQ